MIRMAQTKRQSTQNVLITTGSTYNVDEKKY